MKSTIFALLLLGTLYSYAQAEDFASAKDAETIVAEAVKAISNNKDATLKEITAKDAKWVDQAR